VERLPAERPSTPARAEKQAIRTLSSPTAVTIHSVFDSEGRRIAEYNETSGALIREYVWNGWDPVAVIEGGVISFVRADHIGRPVFATNATGTKVWTATYTPFGGVHTSTGTLPSARFPGQWFQSESGLHQNWMRDYDPTTGRYLQADPLGLVDGASVYGYVGQSPGNSFDITGEYESPLKGYGSGIALGPGLGDAFNPGGIMGDTSRNYTKWFDNRFPNSVAGAANALRDRIRDQVCLNRLLPKLPPLGPDLDIDISPDMKRFGDVPQSWYETHVAIGFFEFRTDEIIVDWENCPNCFSYSTKMYVRENTGDNRYWLFRERVSRMAEWPLEGSGYCDF
jgi:RHS repeat-associated protein